MRFFFYAFTLILIVTGAACTPTSYPVMRIQNGHLYEGRFISSKAYEASLQASISETEHDWKSSISWLKKALYHDSTALDLQIRLAAALCKNNQIQEAIESFESVLVKDKNNERAWTERGTCFLHSKQPNAYAKARRDFEQAIQVDPNALEPALALIKLDVLEGNRKEARARVEEQVLLHPTSALAYRWLAILAVHEGEIHRALHAAQKSLILDSKEGREALIEMRDAVDRLGVVKYSLSVRQNETMNRTQFQLHSKTDSPMLAFVEHEAATQKALSKRLEQLFFNARLQTLEELSRIPLPQAIDHRLSLALYLGLKALHLMHRNGNLAWRLAHTAIELAPVHPVIVRIGIEVAHETNPSTQELKQRLCMQAETQVEHAHCHSFEK